MSLDQSRKQLGRPPLYSSKCMYTPMSQDRISIPGFSRTSRVDGYLQCFCRRILTSPLPPIINLSLDATNRDSHFIRRDLEPLSRAIWRSDILRHHRYVKHWFTAGRNVLRLRSNTRCYVSGTLHVPGRHDDVSNEGQTSVHTQCREGTVRHRLHWPEAPQSSDAPWRSHADRNT